MISSQTRFLTKHNVPQAKKYETKFSTGNSYDTKCAAGKIFFGMNSDG